MRTLNYKGGNQQGEHVSTNIDLTSHIEHVTFKYYILHIASEPPDYYFHRPLRRYGRNPLETILKTMINSSEREVSRVKKYGYVYACVQLLEGDGDKGVNLQTNLVVNQGSKENEQLYKSKMIT
eukprot:TRINITY_DN72745_c0_g1_i1.p2 TRINITY_DN72745_c0_g1~~TRINITY_DN72745_c0_g1_i1.p2  ORF type:complete len:124 (-),score=2.32 TRINITY_DN72745_c0_g1_i1:361-732(-)